MKAVVAALGRTCLIGAATGLRSQCGLAAVSWTTAPPADVPGGSGCSGGAGQTPLLARPWVRGATLAAAAGEFVADKSSRVPSRLSAAGLGPRLVMSVLAAVLLARRERPRPSLIATAVTGASAAVASSYAGTRWRLVAGPRAQALAPVAEDFVALVLAWAACKRTTGPAHAAGQPSTGTSTAPRGTEQITWVQDRGDGERPPA
ncbi:hypothetical protein [Streptomyces sp. NPDC047028]|uniref:hypothetical protein n=1 Tax=Streptomyces sp. NPDC047028 TaxID=3155793 RepID=UPI00340C0473